MNTIDSSITNAPARAFHFVFRDRTKDEDLPLTHVLTVTITSTTCPHSICGLICRETQRAINKAITHKQYEHVYFNSSVEMVDEFTYVVRFGFNEEQK